MFDPNNVMSNGINLILVVFGLVEFCKAVFSLEGKAVTVLSMAMGAVVMTLFQLAEIVPEPYALIFKIVLTSLTFGLAASGMYKFTNARAPSVTFLNDKNDPDVNKG